ncbi:MAG TPA: sulfurtransferase, partial [Methanophagales archaeon]|nr:sulfurtransferase [Methanophagales archaeon]
MKRFVLSVVVGIVLLTVIIGTLSGLMCAVGRCSCGCRPTSDYLGSPISNSPPSGFFGGDLADNNPSNSKSQHSDLSEPSEPSEPSDTTSETPIPIRPANSQYENPRLIVYIDELKNISDPNVLIVDVRSPEKYAEGHIPGAIELPWYLFREDKGVLTSVENVTGILGEYGISPDNRVIVYSDTCAPCGGLAASSYIFWMLEYIGHENVSVLDGGFDAWCTVYNTTETVTTRSPTNYTANVSKERFADTEWVQNSLNNTMVQIMDARTTEDYNAGHIDGAINIEYEELFRDGDRLKGVDELGYLFSPVVSSGLSKSKDTVVYCGSGARSSFLYLALRLMGYQVRNYDGSWNIWSETHFVPSIPISNVSANPSFAYKGDTVRIFAEVGIILEGGKGTAETPIISGRYTPTFIPGTCAGCGGSYVPPSANTNVSFVRAYIYKEDGTEVPSVFMHDYNGDGRYVGEWQTLFAEEGIYYIDIEATAGELKTKKQNAA